MVAERVLDILDFYSSEPPGVKANLVRLLMSGKLAGTGKLLILPVDQGFEHGPFKSFEVNPVSYDPEYHFKLALDAGMSAYAAPIGMLQVGADKYAGRIPLILKLNSSTSLRSEDSIPDQAIIANVSDALRLGCAAVGFTIYPGSENYFAMIEKLASVISEARSVGLAIIVWAYARGKWMAKDDETALDVVSYGAHMACLLGAHIVKVKLPSSRLALKSDVQGDIKDLAYRVRMVKRSCLDGKRLVVFSGGGHKDSESLYEEVLAIKRGGGDGSIIGRNSFQRVKKDSIDLLNGVIKIYQEG